MQIKSLLAVILCGGESKRMGTDKGLIPIKDTIRAQYVADKLEPFTLPVVFSVNARQVSTYSVYITPDKLIDDAVEAQGPLKGLLSVHKTFPDHHILLLSCDLLDLDKVTISKMIKTYLEETEHEFIVYQDTEYAQPFCGIYTSSGLARLLQKMHAHHLHDFSLQSVLNEGKTLRLAITNSRVFENYNLP